MRVHASFYLPHEICDTSSPVSDLFVGIACHYIRQFFLSHASCTISCRTATDSSAGIAWRCIIWDIMMMYYICSVWYTSCESFFILLVMQHSKTKIHRPFSRACSGTLCRVTYVLPVPVSHCGVHVLGATDVGLFWWPVPTMVGQDAFSKGRGVASSHDSISHLFFSLLASLVIRIYSYYRACLPSNVTRCRGVIIAPRSLF